MVAIPTLNVLAAADRQPLLPPNLADPIRLTRLRVAATATPNHPIVQSAVANPPSSAAKPSLPPPAAIPNQPIIQSSVANPASSAAKLSLPTATVPAASEPLLPPNLADPIRPTQLRVAATATPNQPIVQSAVANPTSSTPEASPPSAVAGVVTPSQDPIAESIQLNVLQSRFAAFQVASLGMQALGFPVANAGARIGALAKSPIEVKAIEALSTYG